MGEEGEGSFETDFEKDTKPLKETVHAWITKWYGEKCSEFSPGCEICERWRLAEQLFAIDREGSGSLEWW